MDIPVPIKDPEEMIKVDDLKEEDKNKNIVKEEKNEFINFQNINSPQLIQDILHLSSHSTQNGFQHQNNLIKSLYSFNDSILPILDDNFSEDDINFNPRIIFLKKRNKLNMMNFAQINSRNNFLLQKINQYNDLQQKISDFKSLEIKEKEINNDNQEENKKELNLKLFLVNHPLINLFKDEIDIIKLKDEIQKEYLKGMKDNTNYKPGPPNPHLINILEQNVSANEENEEENEGEIDEVAVSLVSEPSGEALEEPDVVIYDNHSEEDEEDPVLEIAPNPNNQVQAVENHENINENQNIQQEHEEQNLPNNINNEIQINNIFAFDEIQPIQPLELELPIQPLEPIQPMQQLEPEQPMQPLEPEQPLEPLQPPQNDINIQEILPMPIIDQNLNYHIDNNQEQPINNIEENNENENINEIQHDENQNSDENINQNIEENKENNE
jgi:hypothetical protein